VTAHRKPPDAITLPLQTFPIGSTNVTCSTTDGALTLTRTFTVTVRDTTPPALTVPADVTRDGDGPWGLRGLVYSPSVTDAVGGVTTTCTPPSGSTFPFGTTLVTCRAVDGAGTSRRGRSA